MKLRIHPNLQRVLWVLGGCLIGAFLCFVYYHVSAQSVGRTLPLRESDLNPASQYQFTDPLVGLQSTGTSDDTEYDALRQKVLAYIGQEVGKDDLTTASVLFNDYSQSAGFNINPNEEYSPASLLKVPVMMTYYSLAEQDSSILNQQIYFSGAQNADLQEHIVSPIQLMPGQTYTVEQLIEHMIKYSDNNAAQLLVNNLNNTGHATATDDLFKNLGITNIDLTNDFMTIRAYSLFFRVLYNSTYLDPGSSEKALKLLTQSDFTKGIDAGVPNDVLVAQKFGEFTLLSPNDETIREELHNCGIVYFPDHPYLLCVMTKGSNFTKLEDVIATISQMTYQTMEQNYPSSAPKH